MLLHEGEIGGAPEGNAFARAVMPTVVAKMDRTAVRERQQHRSHPVVSATDRGAQMPGAGALNAGGQESIKKGGVDRFHGSPCSHWRQ